jgi:hypothetical protein
LPRWCVGEASSGSDSFLRCFSVFAVTIALGSSILRLFRLRVLDTFEQGLFACGVGFFAFEPATFSLNAAGLLNKTGAWCLIVVAAAVAWRGWASVIEFAARVGSGTASRWRGRHWWMRFLLCIAAVCVLEALLASAPITASDAMHYHFTAPLLQIAGRFSPRFDITHSFLTGQAHLLISFGLALGSDRFALGPIFLGGLLTAATLYLIARQFMSGTWPEAVAQRDHSPTELSALPQQFLCRAKFVYRQFVQRLWCCGNQKITRGVRMKRAPRVWGEQRLYRWVGASLAGRSPSAYWVPASKCSR